MQQRQARLEKIYRFVRKMPSLPTSVSKVLEICIRTDASPNDLNKVISLDPVLTGQVLKLINSAYYSLVNEVTSLTRAIIMLGLNTVKNMALSSAIISCVGQSKKSKALPVKAFWAHSLGVGVVAKLLAGERNVPMGEREEYFVAGLLHDLGKFPFDDEYTDVVHTARTNTQPLIKVERELLEIDHAEVGLLIAEKWKLNNAITETIRYHHDPDAASEENRALVATVALADFFVCLFDIGFAGNRFPDEAVLERALVLSGLHWSTVVGLFDRVNEEISKAEIFLQA
ncbi:MAG: metal-dependent phosphohydrolase [Desulfobulbus propionicus]|nr:MAG: metal-dependent phosphohydrolase [Desulfobulbus propionicus]